MKYYSTRDKNVSLSAAEAVKMGLSRSFVLLACAIVIELVVLSIVRARTRHP